MPITSSAKKALRGSLRRRKRNLARKSAYKSAIKEYKRLTLEKRLEEARAKLQTVYKSLDKAAKTGSIKKNKANRLKSRLSGQLKSAQG